MPTDIEWTHFPNTIGETWNPINATRMDNGKRGWHCEKVSPGCANCYAETFNGRNLPACGTGLDYTVPSRALVQIGIHEDTLSKPLHWAKPRTIFVCSMADLFADFVPYEMIRKVLGLVGICKKHRFIILTKRSERMREVVTRFYAEWRENDQFRETAGRWAARDYSYRPCIETPFANLILGVSVESRDYLHRIDDLRATPAACRIISAEPLLGPLDGLGLGEIDWLISGGESGPGARPMHPDWARSLRDQCTAARVPFFWKQWGQWIPAERGGLSQLPPNHGIKDQSIGPDRVKWLWRDGQTESLGEYSAKSQPLEDAVLVMSVGKKQAGRLLDGRQWSEFPKMLEAGR